MKADPQAQQLLLEVQRIDTTLQQLQHQRRHLPELATLAQLTADQSTLDEQRSRAQDEVARLDREIARIERDVEQVRARKDRDSARLAAGTGPARELEAIQHEIGSLDRRQRELEDGQLEVMEQREQAQSDLTQVDRRLAEVRRAVAEAETARDRALAEITEQEQSQRQAREPMVGSLPADLLSLYERVRDDTGGLGAALLSGGRCGGCRLELSGSERGRIRAAPPDEVVRCEECRRIMIRTTESGL